MFKKFYIKKISKLGLISACLLSCQSYHAMQMNTKRSHSCPPIPMAGNHTHSERSHSWIPSPLLASHTMGEQKKFAYHLLFPKEIDAIKIQELSDMFSKSTLSMDLGYDICNFYLNGMNNASPIDAPSTPKVIEQARDILSDRIKMTEEEFSAIDKDAQESERCKIKVERYNALRAEQNALKRTRENLFQDTASSSSLNSIQKKKLKLDKKILDLSYQLKLAQNNIRRHS